MLIKKPVKLKWDLTSTDSKVKEVVSYIYNDLELGTQSVNKKKELLTTVLMNLLLSSYSGSGIQYPRGSEWYQNVPSKYKYYFQTYHYILKIVDGLLDKGYITHRIGEWDMQSKYREQSVMNPTPKLITLYKDFTTGVTEYRQPIQTVLLREILREKVKNLKTGRFRMVKTRKPISYTDTSEIIAMRGIIKKWNDLRGKSIITFTLPTELVREVNNDDEHCLLYNADVVEKGDGIIRFKLRHRYAYRVFTNKFDRYGRYSGANETFLNKKIRPYFVINGEPTVEIDFEAIHIRMLYNLEGLDCSGDPYQAAADTFDVEEYKVRKYFKRISLYSINGTNVPSSIKGVKDALRNDKANPIKIPYPMLKRMLKHWSEIHEPISKYLCSGKGLELMYLDSQIAQKVIKHFTDQGILALCVYDSFIVARRYKDELSRVMKSAYLEVLECEFDVPMASKELRDGEVEEEPVIF